MKRLVYAFTVSSLFLLSGCWDKAELEEQAYVVVMGLDQHEEDENAVKVTFQIANPQVGSSARGDEADEPPSDIVTLVASDVAIAKEQVHAIVTRKISFRHLATLIVSEKLARSDQHHQLIASLIIDPEVRHAMSFIVSKEEAKDFIHANKPRLETRPHKYFQFMRERWREIGYVPDSNLNRYFQRLGGELFLAAYATAEKNNAQQPRKGYLAGELPQEGGDPVQIIGSAVFRYGKMIGTLNGRETRTALFLREQSFVRNAMETFTDPLNEKFEISARIIEAYDPDIKLNLKKNPIEIDVTIPVRLQMVSDLSLTDYSTNLKNQTRLKKSIQKQLEKRTMEMIKKTQEEYQSEPFLWYLNARRHFRTLKEYEAFNWSEKYKNAKVSVQYEVEIANFGEQTKPAKLRKPKGGHES